MVAPPTQLLGKKDKNMNATPTLEMLDPATLTVDINVRKDAEVKALLGI